MMMTKAIAATAGCAPRGRTKLGTSTNQMALVVTLMTLMVIHRHRPAAPALGRSAFLPWLLRKVHLRPR